MLKRRLQRLIPVYTCQNVKLLENLMPRLIYYCSLPFGAFISIGRVCHRIIRSVSLFIPGLMSRVKKEQKNVYLELVEILYLGMYRSISICKFLSEKFQFIYIVS